MRLAALFGSTSTGEDTEDSDVDLLVAYRRESGLAFSALRQRLSHALGRRMHLVSLDAKLSANLLADILSEGRVVIDRDGLWPGLRDEHAHILKLAAQEDIETLSHAYATVEAAKKRLES